jgi:hypothetical protein
VDVDPRPSVLGLVSGSAFNMVYEMIEWLWLIIIFVGGVIVSAIDRAANRIVEALNQISYNTRAKDYFDD